MLKNVMILFNKRCKSNPTNDKNLKVSKFQLTRQNHKPKIFYIILFFIFLAILLFIHAFIFLRGKYKKEINNSFQSINNTINITDIYNKMLLKGKITYRDEVNACQIFVEKALSHTLINPNEIFYRSENPKISVVIPMYNAEGYIENGIYAIENQDFKDIEIIIIDDKSKDNSVEIVKKLMKKDPRIYLYGNKETKGTLYSKSIGVTYSKGKYVLVSDQDDLYTQEDAFLTMYYQLEKNKLDILGFGSIFTLNSYIKNEPSIYFSFNSPVYHQPYISQRMYHVTKTRVRRIGDVIWNYIYKTDVFKKSISQIDDKIMNTRMNCHEDFLLFFLLTRNAKSLKNIKRVFYAHIYWRNSKKESILFAKKEKALAKKNYKCLSYINYIEFLLYRTKDTVNDKRIASYELNNWYLNHKECKNNTFIQKRAKNVCKLFLENQNIQKDVKEKILLFLNIK